MRERGLKKSRSFLTQAIGRIALPGGKVWGGGRALFWLREEILLDTQLELQLAVGVWSYECGRPRHRWYVKLGAWRRHRRSEWWLGSTEHGGVLTTGGAGVVTTETAVRVCSV